MEHARSNVRTGSIDEDDALGDEGLMMDQYYGEGEHLEMDEQEMDLQVRRSSQKMMQQQYQNQMPM